MPQASLLRSLTSGLQLLTPLGSCSPPHPSAVSPASSAWPSMMIAFSAMPYPSRADALNLVQEWTQS